MKKNLLLFFSCFVIFTGCAAQQNVDEAQSKDAPPITKLSTEQSNYKHHANNIKKQIAEFSEITSAHVVSNDATAIIAFDVKHRHRLKLKPLRKKVQKKVKDMYPEMEITVSTDQKIISELEDLDERKNTLSTNKLKNELERIIKMEIDET